MNLKNWEATIQQIADESNREPKQSARQRHLTAWRAKLEQHRLSSSHIKSTTSGKWGGTHCRKPVIIECVSGVSKNAVLTAGAIGEFCDGMLAKTIRLA